MKVKDLFLSIRNWLPLPKWRRHYRAGAIRYLIYYYETLDQLNNRLGGANHDDLLQQHGQNSQEQFQDEIEMKALGALEQEKSNILHAVQLAFTLREWELVTDMAQNLVAFFNRRAYWQDWIETQRIALTAAQKQCRAWLDEYWGS